MAGRGYTIFDSTIGRCGIAWGTSGIVAVQLPEAREIETRRRMLRQYPDARELRPSLNAQIAIEGIAALLRSQPSNFSDVTLDMRGMPPFNRRVCEVARTIPRGETVTLAEFARQLGASGATHAVGQAIGRNPFAILVPCHRVLPPTARRTGSASIAARSPSADCFRSKARWPGAGRRCSMRSFPLRRRVRIAKSTA